MRKFRTNVVVFGGGIAGLWLLDALRRDGRNALLVENRTLGAGQTIASQGILHSGLKYSLKGFLTAAAKEAREMPLLWRKCLRGEAEPNLQEARVLSENFYLWSSGSAASQLGMLGAKLGLQVTPRAVGAEARPEFLRSCSGAVYRVDEQVLSPASLLEALAARNRDAILRIDAEAGVEFDSPATGATRVMRLRSPGGAEEIEVEADWIVLTAGEGNGALRKALGLEAERMQRRPLHMVMARGTLPEFFGHCVDGAKTRISITSATDAAERSVWQIGGQIAEDGVQLDSDALIERAHEELGALLPELDLQGTEWTTYRVDRAETATMLGARPDSFSVLRDGNVLTAWPTKLVLAPQLANAVMAQIGSSKLVSVGSDELPDWPRPEVALPPWEREHVWRSFSGVSRTVAR